MIWAFIDYENIGNLKGFEFNKYQRVFIFLGPKNSKINIGDAAITEFLKIEIIKIKTNGSTNLDFHMAYYLGKTSQTAQKDVQFHVITRDNGFNGLINHIRKTGRSCKKITMEKEAKKGERKLSPCSELAIDKLKKIDGRKRPRKAPQLINWIESQCRSLSKNIDAESILGELVKVGVIDRDNLVIKYKLKSYE